MYKKNFSVAQIRSKKENDRKDEKNLSLKIVKIFSYSKFMIFCLNTRTFSGSQSTYMSRKKILSESKRTFLMIIWNLFYQSSPLIANNPLSTVSYKALHIYFLQVIYYIIQFIKNVAEGYFSSRKFYLMPYQNSYISDMKSFFVGKYSYEDRIGKLFFYLFW